MLTVADALEVKRAVQARLLAIPGVHTVGFGGKTSGGKPIGEFAILVYVRRKKSRAELSPAELIPPEIQGVKTDVIESGPMGTRFSALQGGDEIFAEHPSAGEVHSADGTLGCIARSAAAKDADPPDVLLTCRHVLYQENDIGTPGDEVTVSSCCGCCHPTVAKVLDGPKIGPEIDAAIAKFVPGTDIKAQIHDTPVKGIFDISDLAKLPVPVQNAIKNHTYRVYQYGKKSGFTRGQVFDVDAATVKHSKQIRIMPLERDYFTQKGDSGSVVYNDDNLIVGLHWGGVSKDEQPDGQRASFANHIATVLAAFPGLRIATNPPEVVYRTPGIRKLPPVMERLHRDLAATRSVDYFTGLYGKHQEEFRWLFEHSRHFVSAWHRNHGPKMVRALMDLAEDRIPAVPEFLEERSWKDCTHRIAGALLFAGSESLQNDVLRHLSFSAALGGRSYAEVLDLMRSLAMAVN
jgi:hypothetical protein